MTREESKERLQDILEEATTGEEAVCYVTSYDEEAIKMAIKALEEPQWIPCSERLPEEDGGLYLVTDYAKSINRRGVHLSRCYMNKDCFWSNVLLGYKVIAWMPLPEAWRGDVE